MKKGKIILFILLIGVLLSNIPIYTKAEEGFNPKPCDGEDASLIWGDPSAAKSSITDTAKYNKTVKNNGYYSAIDLFGDHVSIISYHGEEGYNDTDDHNYFYSNYKTVNKQSRNVTVKCEAKNKNNYHIKALELTDEEAIIAGGFSTFFYVCGEGLTWLMLKIKHLDVTVVTNLVKDNLAGELKTIFIGTKKGSSVKFSNIFIIFLLLWFISFAILMFKRLMGRAPMQKVLKEFGIGLFALILSTSIIVYDLEGSINTFANSFVTKMIVALSDIEDDSSIALFKQKLSTDDKSTEDANENEQHFLDKAAVDSKITSIFGINISDLDINKGFKKIKKDDWNPKLKVTNGTKEGTVYNLGYAYWAGQQNQFYTCDATVSDGCNNTYYYIIDFLEANKKDNQEKCDDIFRNLTDLPELGIVGSAGLYFLLSVAFIWASIATLFLYWMGKLVFLLGMFLIPIIPMLMLFEKTRSSSSRLIKTYLAGILRMLLGQGIFSITLIIFMYFSEQSEYGIKTLGVVLIGILGYVYIKFLIPAINNFCNRIDGGNAITHRGTERLSHFANPKQYAFRRTRNLHGKRKAKKDLLKEHKRQEELAEKTGSSKTDDEGNLILKGEDGKSYMIPKGQFQEVKEDDSSGTNNGVPKPHKKAETNDLGGSVDKEKLNSSKEDTEGLGDTVDAKPTEDDKHEASTETPTQGKSTVTAAAAATAAATQPTEGTPTTTSSAPAATATPATAPQPAAQTDEEKAKQEKEEAARKAKEKREQHDNRKDPLKDDTPYKINEKGEIKGKDSKTHVKFESGIEENIDPDKPKAEESKKVSEIRDHKKTEDRKAKVTKKTEEPKKEKKTKIIDKLNTDTMVDTIKGKKAQKAAEKAEVRGKRKEMQKNRDNYITRQTDNERSKQNLGDLNVRSKKNN